MHPIRQRHDARLEIEVGVHLIDGFVGIEIGGDLVFSIAVANNNTGNGNGTAYFNTTANFNVDRTNFNTDRTKQRVKRTIPIPMTTNDFGPPRPVVETNRGGM